MISAMLESALEDLRAELRAVFVEKIQSLMAREGLKTGDELAYRVGVTKSTGHNWLNGVLPQLPHLYLIAKKFGVDPNYLMGWETDEAEIVAGATDLAQAADAGEEPSSPPPRSDARRRSPDQAAPPPRASRGRRDAKRRPPPPGSDGGP
jgi:transcriptional regulator with XRE-family HTH domain